MYHQKDCNHTHCTSAISNESVTQTLTEMDWERGIWNAAFNGEEDKVRQLIEKSSDIAAAVNAPDNSGYTALHYAARNGHIDVCQLLLQNGANIDAQTRTGFATPLHKASASGNVAAIKFLIKSGATIELQDVDGQTALHKAVQNKRLDLYEVLLNACPQLRDIKDNKGNLAIP